MPMPGVKEMASCGYTAGRLTLALHRSPSHLCLAFFLQSAEAEYRELLRQFPQYGDCCLRLACIAKARGDTKVRLRTSLQSP